MASNPYAPPESPILETVAFDSAALKAPFFAVSQTKLVVLTFCTFGVYQLYWFYQNWRMVKRRTREKIMPVWRTLFGVFFCHALFTQVRDYDPASPAAKLNAGALAAIWIVLAILARLPDPYWLVTFLSVFALLPVQVAIKAINEKEAPGLDPNAAFTAWNWAAVAIGLPLLALLVYGLFFLPAEQT